MEALRTADPVVIERLAVSEPRAASHLVGRLWDQDPGVRSRAAAGVGAAAAAHAELGRELIRRLLWALNEESGSNGVYALAALGEIGARAPALIEPFLGRMVSCATDDGLRPELPRALVRIAAVLPRLVATHVTARWCQIDGPDPGSNRLAVRLRALLENDHGSG